jgi:hypothetical protein
MDQSFHELEHLPAWNFRFAGGNRNARLYAARALSERCAQKNMVRESVK